MMGKRRVTLVLAALAAIGSPPLSATAGEPAWSEKAIKERIDPASLVGMIAGLQLENLAEEGRDLFEARFTTLDGAGRPNATQAIVPTAPRRPAEFVFQRCCFQGVTAFVPTFVVLIFETGEPQKSVGFGVPHVPLERVPDVIVDLHDPPLG